MVAGEALSCYSGQARTGPPPMGRAKQLRLERKRKKDLILAPTLYEYFNVDQVEKLGSEDPAAKYLAMSTDQAELLRLSLASIWLSTCFKISPLFLRNFKSLPLQFVLSFTSLLGHLLAPGRIKERWPQICTDLCAISSGVENQKALARWPFVEGGALDLNDARVSCFSILESITNDPLEYVEPNTFRKIVLCANSIDIDHDAIRNHLVISSCDAAGFTLCKAGSLVLTDQSCGRQMGGRHGFDPLWLVRLRPDGIFAYGGLAEIGGLLPSEVKNMKDFVSGYNGKPLRGEFIGGRDYKAAKLCNAVGLRVDGMYAWLESRDEFP